jgi:hypothetical protein
MLRSVIGSRFRDKREFLAPRSIVAVCLGGSAWQMLFIQRAPVSSRLVSKSQESGRSRVRSPPEAPRLMIACFFCYNEL